MAAVTMSSVLGSRAALVKPFSAKPAQRRVITTRAGDPSAPDPSQVDSEVRQCECPAPRKLELPALGSLHCADGSPSWASAVPEAAFVLAGKPFLLCSNLGLGATVLHTQTGLGSTA